MKQSSSRRSDKETHSRRPGENTGSAKLCAVEPQCGACQFLTVPYRRQLGIKQQRIVSMFSDVTDRHTVTHAMQGMDDPYFYRNKVISPFARGRKLPGNQQSSRKDPLQKNAPKKSSKRDSQIKPCYEILTGMYASRSHRIVSTDSCVIENGVAKRIIIAIRDLMSSFRIEPYNEDTGTGFLRHAQVRVGHSSGEVLVTLVTNSPVFARSKDFCRALVKRCPEITSVVQNVNSRQTNVILGEEETTLYGPGFILDKICGLSFRISSRSFYQVNASQTDVLYRRSIEMAHLSGSETVIDAYCGTGTIGLVAAKGFSEDAHAARVIGIDKVNASIRDARMNAKHNGIKNAEFVAEDAGEYLLRLAGSDGADDLARREDDAASHHSSSVDVVFMDPPRAGASEGFLNAVVRLLPPRIVYISCNPQTQIRDVEYLTRRGYRVDEIQPVDMFPHTDHIENIVSLTIKGLNDERVSQTHP